MAYSHLDEDDRESIWRLRAEGKNTNEISKIVGRAYSTVATMLREAGGVRSVQTTASTSTLRLSDGDREEISRGVRAETFDVNAARIGRAPSTVSREVARNGGRSSYRATVAVKATTARLKRPKTAKLSAAPELRTVVVDKFKLLWSPQQIAAWLRETYPDDQTMWVSHIEDGLTACVRSGRSQRRPWRRGRREKRGKNPSMVLIDQRPAEVETRLVAGTRKETSSWDEVTGGRSQRSLSEHPGSCCSSIWSTGIRPSGSAHASWNASPTCQQSCYGPSPGTRAPRCQATNNSPRRPASRCSSLTRVAPGSGARTRTPIGASWWGPERLRRERLWCGQPGDSENTCR